MTWDEFIVEKGKLNKDYEEVLKWVNDGHKQRFTELFNRFQKSQEG